MLGWTGFSHTMAGNFNRKNSQENSTTIMVEKYSLYTQAEYSIAGIWMAVDPVKEERRKELQLNSLSSSN